RISAGSLVLEHSLPYIPHALLIAAVCQICMYYTDMYDFRVSLSPSKLFVKLLQSLGVAGVVLAVFFYWLSQLVVGRRILLLSLLIAFCFIGGWRLLYRWLQGTKQFRVKVLILGTGEEARKLAGELWEKQPLGYEIRGFIGDSNEVGKEIL